MSVLYTIDTNGYKVPTIEEWEVVKETEKQYKVRHPKYSFIFVVNKKEMRTFENCKCVRKFYKTKEEAIRGLNDYCVSLKAQKEKEIEEAQKLIKECNETIKRLWE